MTTTCLEPVTPAVASEPLCEPALAVLAARAACGPAIKTSATSNSKPRTFGTRFGAITVQRIRGYCKRCRKWRVPADAAPGLEKSAGYSPAVQDMAALLASKMPVEDDSVVREHLTGVKLAPRQPGSRSPSPGRTRPTGSTNPQDTYGTEGCLLSNPRRPQLLKISLPAARPGLPSEFFQKPPDSNAL